MIFVHQSLLYTLEKYKPDLTLVPLHGCGIRRGICTALVSKEAFEALRRHGPSPRRDFGIMSAAWHCRTYEYRYFG